MLSGILLLALGGALWCLVGICYEKLPEEEESHPPFLFAGGVITCLLLGLCFMPEKASLEEILTVALFLIPAGLLTLPQVVFLKKALTCGSPGGAWCIMQSAMMCPLLAMILLYGERLSIPAWCGIGVLALGIVAWGIGKKEGEAGTCQSRRDHGRYLLFSLLAFLCTGLQQILTLIPSKMPSLGENALSWRVFLMQLPLLLWGIPCAVKKQPLTGKAWKYGAVLGASIAGGELLFFCGIDAMNRIKLSGLAYPAALNFCILLFALYCRFYLKRPFRKVEILALLLTVTGITLLIF